MGEKTATGMGEFVIVMGTDVDGVLRGKFVPKDKIAKAPDMGIKPFFIIAPSS